MVELLHHVGRQRAVWVGHDWGSPVVWSLASHHPNHTVAVASASYFGINHFSTLHTNCQNVFDCKQTLGTWCWTPAADTSSSNCCSAPTLPTAQRTPLPITLRAPLQALAPASPVGVHVHAFGNSLCVGRLRLARGLGVALLVFQTLTISLQLLCGSHLHTPARTNRLVCAVLVAGARAGACDFHGGSCRLSKAHVPCRPVGVHAILRAELRTSHRSAVRQRPSTTYASLYQPTSNVD